MAVLLWSWIQVLERLVRPQPIKWLQKSSVKTQAFALAWKFIWTCGSCSDVCLQNFEHFFAFRQGSLPHLCLQWKFIVSELPATFLSFGCLYLGILDFTSQQYFCMLDFCVINLQWPLRFVCLVYSLHSNIFVWVLFSYYRNPEKKN